jgi:hypothetical protein
MLQGVAFVVDDIRKGPKCVMLPRNACVVSNSLWCTGCCIDTPSLGSGMSS